MFYFILEFYFWQLYANFEFYVTDFIDYGVIPLIYQFESAFESFMLSYSYFFDVNLITTFIFFN